MKNARLRIALFFTLAVSLPGCASHTYSALASQTLEQPGARDVVWLLEDDAHHVLRCHYDGDEPVCQRAEVR